LLNFYFAKLVEKKTKTPKAISLTRWQEAGGHFSFLFFFFTEKCFLSFEQNKKSFLSALLLFLSCNDSAPDSSQ